MSIKKTSRAQRRREARRKPETTMVRFQTETLPCPVCGQALNGWTAMASDNPQPPEPGDCSACIHCYSIIEFAPGGGYQTCDFDSLPADLQEYMLGVVAEMRSNTGRFRRAMDDSRRMGAQVGRTIRPYKTPGTQ